MISLPYGGKNAQFDEQDLIAHMVKSGRDYIIQGQQNCSFADHTKPNSLDYWLRVNRAVNRDIKQAVRSVIDDLVKTGLFQEVDDLQCPDSGRLCKGIRLTKTPQKHDQHETTFEGKYNTNLAAEFYVLSCLYRLGLDASLTLGNKKMVDIIVLRPSGMTITSLSAVYLIMTAASYLGAGRYQEAVKASELMLDRSRKGEINPFWAHVFLAEAYAELGQLDKARAEAEEVMKINPNYSLEIDKVLAAYRDPMIKERRLAALRKAGLK